MIDWKAIKDHVVNVHVDVSGAKNMGECVSMFLKEEWSEHMTGSEEGIKWKSKEQAVAAAYSYCRQKGFKDSVEVKAGYIEQAPVIITKIQEDEKYIHADVTIAAEMVQDYHISEVWWMADALPENTEFVPIRKDYKELTDMLADLDTRNIKQIPYVMPHTHEIFQKDQIPEKLKDDLEPIASEDIKGYFDSWKRDDKTKKVKGRVHCDKAKCGEETIQKIRDGKPISVSIGFICDFDLDGGELNGRHFVATQRHLQLGHLAGLLEGSGKCPVGICGINQDSSKKIHLTKLLLSFPEFISNPNSVAPLTKVKSISNIPSKIASHGDVKNTIPLLLHKEVSSMADDEILKENLRLKAELDGIKNSQTDAKIKEISAQLTDTQTKLGLAMSANTVKDKEITELKEQVAQKDKKIKEFEDKAVEEDRSYLATKFGGLDAVIPEVGKKVRELCAHDTQFAAKLFRGKDDNKLKTNGIPKPDQKAYTEGHDASVDSEEDIRVDV